MPDEVLFNSLLDGCVRADAFKIGELVFKKMKQSHIELSVVAYSIMIKMYGKTGQIEKAFEMLREIQENNLQPGLIVYTCMIKACCQCKNPERAIDAFEMMKREALPDRVVYQTLIQGLLNSPHFEVTAGRYALEAWSDYGIVIVDDLQRQLLESLKFVDPYPSDLVQQLNKFGNYKSASRKFKGDRNYRQNESQMRNENRYGQQHQHQHQPQHQQQQQWKKNKKPKYVMKHTAPQRNVENRAPLMQVKEERKDKGLNILAPLTNYDPNRAAPQFQYKGMGEKGQSEWTHSSYDEKENRHSGAHKPQTRKMQTYHENYDLRRF